MDEQLIPIYVMGKRYEVPSGLTIMTAMEWIGYKYVRGCGCRGGFCGACATVFRVPGDYKLQIGLACQTQIIPGMHLTQIPFYPAPKVAYDLEKVKDPAEALLSMFPEITKCVGCGVCAKSCPHNLKPIDYVAACLRGDYAKAADISFDCIMCGLCASRCTGELVPYQIAMFARRYFSKFVRPKPKHLIERNAEIKQGKYDKALDTLVRMSEADVKVIYDKRDFEKI